jgi:hypothetical protein
MKRGFSIVLILVLGFTLLSCGKDRLTPQYQAVTVNELLKNKPVNFSYRIDDTSIDEYGKGPGKFPVFGKLFKAMAQVIANATIGPDGVELDPPPIVVDMTSMLKIDFNSIEVINIDQLNVSIRESKSQDNLKFLDKIEIYAKVNSPVDGLVVNEEGFVRLLYYDRKVDSLGCEEKCLVLNVDKINWKKLLQENPIILIKPHIVLNSVPLSTMRLAGSIAFRIKFNVGF